MHSFAIHTLGCKVNQYETETIVNDFLERGFNLVDFSDRADVYIINTCTVTGTSDHKSRQWISRAVQANAGAIVVVAGCYAERAKQEIEGIQGVDLIVGNPSKGKISKLVSQRLGTEFAPRGVRPVTQHFHTRSLVKAQDGCNNFCSFCIVPYVRGRPTSRPLEEIAEEMQNLVNAGVKEIVLTGVNLGKYGLDLKPRLKLMDLLKAAEKILVLARIRLSSIEANDLTTDVIALLASSPKFCRHLHIPLQSADDEILKGMHRNYTCEEYLRTVGEIKRNIPGVALTTDVMVAFPGETKQQFERTRLVMEKVAFRKAHVFKYSDRPGTAASHFPGKISFEVKERRSRELLDLSCTLAENFLEAHVGKTLNVLVEKVGKDGCLTGLTDNYMRVHFEGEIDRKGKIVSVLIERREKGSLHGRIV